jgi:hypothetical protein
MRNAFQRSLNWQILGLLPRNLFTSARRCGAGMNRSSFPRVFALLALIATGGTAAITAHADYLPRVGPSALRFQADVPQLPLALLLPGLHSTNLVATTASSTTKTNQPGGLDLVGELAKPVPALETTSPLIADSDPATWTQELVASSYPIVPSRVENARESDIVTPQMLLQYFQRRDALKGEVGVTMPMTFTPPTQSERPSSKATYTVQ